MKRKKLLRVWIYIKMDTISKSEHMGCEVPLNCILQRDKLNRFNRLLAFWPRLLISHLRWVQGALSILISPPDLIKGIWRTFETNVDLS